MQNTNSNTSTDDNTIHKSRSKKNILTVWVLEHTEKNYHILKTFLKTVWVLEHTGPLPHWINIPSSSSAANQHTCCYIPLKEKKGNLAWESVSFLSFYFPISLPGKISIEFHLCDAFYRPLATVWCKMDKLIKGIGWQTHKTYLYTLEPTHKDLLPSSSFESPPSKEVTFLGGHISRHF